MRAYSIPLMLAALSIAAFSAGAADIKRTLKLYAPKPVWSHLDLGTEGPTHGDMRIFEGAVTGENGIKGVIHGILITVGIADGKNVHEDRSGQIHVDLGGGSSIVIAGRSVFVDNSPEMAVDAPQIRAVIGGTGDYIGATGQVTTTRNADGSYEIFFEFLN
jgi:hypothetical protein